MKKLFGLMATGSICLIAACSSEETTAPSWQPGTSGVTPEYCAGMGMVYAQDPNTGTTYCTTPAPLSSSAADIGAVSSSDASLPMQQISSSSIDALGAASSSSAPIADAASSSSAPAAAPASSSAKAPVIESVIEVEDDGIFHLGLWDGTKGDAQVPTGNKGGGYWYSYNDKDNGGESSFTWCSEAGSEYSATDLAPVIKENGGICGEVELLVGTNQWKPYAAIAFSYAKSAALTADATTAKGVCVTYTSTMPIKLTLGMGTTKDNKLGGANPFVTLPKGTNQTMEFAWAEFEQPDWAEVEASGKEAAAALGAITLKFEGDTDGEDGGTATFNIMKLGPVGTCE